MSGESRLLVETVSRLLAELGQTPDEVAESLRAEGVQGLRNAARFMNPVVRWVMRGAELSPAHVDLTQGDRLSVRPPGGGRAEVPLPPAVHQFLAEFDGGKYPDLELPA